MRFNLKIYKRSRRQICRADVLVTSKLERTFTIWCMNLAWQHMFFLYRPCTWPSFYIFCLFVSEFSIEEPRHETRMDRETQCAAKRNKWHIIRRQGFTERSAHTPPTHATMTQWSLLRSTAGHLEPHHAWFCLPMQSLVNLYSTPLHHMAVSGSIRACQRFWREPPIESANEILVYGPGYEEAHLSTHDGYGWLAS